MRKEGGDRLRDHTIQAYVEVQEALVAAVKGLNLVCALQVCCAPRSAVFAIISIRATMLSVGASIISGATLMPPRVRFASKQRTAVRGLRYHLNSRIAR